MVHRQRSIRLSCQTTLRCCNRKVLVVNGQGKALQNEAGECQRDERE